MFSSISIKIINWKKKSINDFHCFCNPKGKPKRQTGNESSDKSSFSPLSLIGQNDQTIHPERQPPIALMERFCVVKIPGVFSRGKCNSIIPYDSILLVLLEMTRWDTWLKQIFAPCSFFPFLHNYFSFSSISLKVCPGKESDNCWSTPLDYRDVMRHHRRPSLFSLNCDIIHISENTPY